MTRGRWDTAVKQEIIAGHGTSEGGQPVRRRVPRSQLLTRRINDLTEHLKVHKHDHHSPPRPAACSWAAAGGLLKYLAAKDITRYRALIGKAGPA